MHEHSPSYKPVDNQQEREHRLDNWFNMIKFIGDLRQVGGFLRVLLFPPQIKLIATILLKYCWKWR